MKRTMRFHLDLNLTLRASVTGNELSHFQDISGDVSEFLDRNLSKLIGENGATIIRAGEPPILVEPDFVIEAADAEEIIE